jgi:hypothetical protein
MSYEVKTGEILPGTLYQVTGDSIVYNGSTIAAGGSFRGIAAVTGFTGNGVVIEVMELRAGTVQLSANANDEPVYPEQLRFRGVALTYEEAGNEKVFDEHLVLRGLALTFELKPAELLVNELTVLKGLAVEFSDTAFYNFQITETRL